MAPQFCMCTRKDIMEQLGSWFQQNISCFHESKYVNSFQHPLFAHHFACAPIGGLLPPQPPWLPTFCLLRGVKENSSRGRLTIMGWPLHRATALHETTVNSSTSSEHHLLWFNSLPLIVCQSCSLHAMLGLCHAGGNLREGYYEK